MKFTDEQKKELVDGSHWHDITQTVHLCGDFENEVSAPVIKCKKTPVKKCRFATERNVIWYTRNRLNGEGRKG